VGSNGGARGCLVVTESCLGQKMLFWARVTMGWVRLGSAGATWRGDTKEDELVGREVEVIPGEGVMIVEASGTRAVVMELSTGTMQTRGTRDGGDGAGHCGAGDGSTEGGVVLKGKILSSKVTWWDR